MSDPGPEVEGRSGRGTLSLLQNLLASTARGSPSAFPRDYRRWVGQCDKGMSPPFPFPSIARGRGRPKDRPEVLLESYQILMRHTGPRSLGGQSGYEIAKALGVTNRAIAYRIRTFVELLPGSWDFVFQDKPSSIWRRSNRWRQVAFPLPAHRGDR